MSNGVAYPDVLSNVDMPGSSVPAAAPGYRLGITVCDPVKQDQGMNAYITYKVRLHIRSTGMLCFSLSSLLSEFVRLSVALFFYFLFLSFLSCFSSSLSTPPPPPSPFRLPFSLFQMDTRWVLS